MGSTRNETREKFFKCSCSSEGVLVTRFKDEPEFYFSYWRQGFNPVKLDWRTRLKMLWMILFEGRCFKDEVIFNQKTSRNLADWINKELNEEKNHKQEKSH